MKLETFHNIAQITADWSVLLMKQRNDDLSDQGANLIISLETERERVNKNVHNHSHIGVLVWKHTHTQCDMCGHTCHINTPDHGHSHEQNSN